MEGKESARHPDDLGSNPVLIQWTFITHFGSCRAEEVAITYSWWSRCQGEVKNDFTFEAKLGLVIYKIIKMYRGLNSSNFKSTVQNFFRYNFINNIRQNYINNHFIKCSLPNMHHCQQVAQSYLKKNGKVLCINKERYNNYKVRSWWFKSKFTPNYK